MARENLYEITIDFNNKGNKELFNDEVEYVGSKGHRDKILITEKLIKIFAYRSTKIELNDVFYNYNNSLYIQILKTLSYYYCTTRKYFEIKEIKVSRKLNSREFEPITLSEGKFNQIVTKDFKLKYQIKYNNLCLLFSGTIKGKKFFSSITYLIKSNDSVDEGEKFERLWKSFNQIYSEIGKSTNSQNNLKSVKTFVVDNSHSFSYSKSMVQGITSNKLENLTRWRAWTKEKNVKTYHHIVLSYTDYRIMEVFKKIIDIMEQPLRKDKKLRDIIIHLNNHIDSKLEVDHEILTIIILNYLYYVRNKFFHGEKIDSTFRLLDNKHINELKWLNQVLEPFIIDLMNLNDKY